jgi:hypothetical protein
MESKRNFFARNRYALSQSIERQRQRWVLLVLFFTVSWARLAAQTQIDALGAGLEVVPTQQTIAEGEDAVFELRMAESAPPLATVIGFELKFELTAAISPACLLDYLGGCIPERVQSSVQVHYNAGTHAVRLSLPRVPAFAMRGLLFRMHLSGIVGLVSVAKAIQSTGGFIIVEDIGFKQAGNAGSAAAPQPQVFPTYARGMLHFDWQGAQPQTVTLVDVRGAQVESVPGTAIHAGCWSTTGLPSGHYKVVVGFATGRQVVRDVWVE